MAENCSAAEETLWGGGARALAAAVLPMMHDRAGTVEALVLRSRSRAAADVLLA